jgi:hypothetical protein
VIGAGLFAGERVAMALALITSVSAPIAVLAGRVRVPRATPVWVELHTVVVLAVVLIGVAYLTTLALRAFAGVLASAQAAARGFAELVQSIPDGIVAVDASGRVESLNPAASRLLGMGPDGVERRPLADVLEARGVRPRPGLWMGRRGGRPQPVSLAGPDGSALLAEALVQDLPRGDGSGGALVMIRDVTEQREAERRQEELREQLQQAQRMEALGHFAGGMAHDFNNVLHVVLGNLDLAALRVGADHAALRHLEEIRKATARAGRLIQQLLAYARRQASVPRKVDLNTIARSLEPLLRPLLPENILLEWALGPELGTVRADPGQIEQVLINLAVNARDAMPRGGTLRIATGHRVLDADTARALHLKSGAYVELSVADTGVGMTDQVKAHLFEPFFTTKTEGRGTGLGLATVFGLVRQAEGHIYAESEVGRGTRFHILLPRVEGPADAEHAAPAPGRQPRGGSETVLLVEDESQVRELNVAALEMFGYRVLEAADGHEALQLAARVREPIHLLVTDVIMPRLGGRELARRIRDLRPQIRVLFASGYAEDGITHDGVLEPGVHLLSKPFSPQDLAARVRHLLETSAP